MDLQELLDNILKGAKYLGTFSLTEMLGFAASRHLSALAVSKEGSRQYYLAFLNGEPEGAIYLDAEGALFGDKAVVYIREGRQYVLCDVKPEIIDALAMGCRIFEKGHLRKNITYAVPEIGKKSEGIGVITLSVLREKEPLNGVRVSIRKDGKIVGSDVTTGKGEVSFRVMYGNYTCTVQDRSQVVRHFSIIFDESHTTHVLDL
ncbi:hypothetical protein [Methanoregula sp.]|uniref:hypothetical protein n=1 Tax=Methanoregula sp. TaxID=2052170 RepID=UPI002CFA81D2|nr:hypothetical protein [Methanoregula sp.]HVP97208.1 hypothetical protein [Methanoregula sp.]